MAQNLPRTTIAGSSRRNDGPNGEVSPRSRQLRKCKNEIRRLSKQLPVKCEELTTAHAVTADLESSRSERQTLQSRLDHISGRDESAQRQITQLAEETARWNVGYGEENDEGEQNEAPSPTEAANSGATNNGEGDSGAVAGPQSSAVPARWKP